MIYVRMITFSGSIFSSVILKHQKNRKKYLLHDLNCLIVSYSVYTPLCSVRCKGINFF